MDEAPTNSTTEVWRQAFALFDTWLDLDETARQAELKRLSSANQDVYRCLLALIRTDASAKDEAFLSAGALAQAARGASASTEIDASLSGLKLGPWTLERPLGAGGMGQVWLAQRHDGLYQGRVAIKMLRDTEANAAANERFAREGQILARLADTNIA